MPGRRIAGVEGWFGWRLPMSSGAHPVSHRVHWLRRRVVWLSVGLAAAGIVLGIVVGIDRAFYSGQAAAVAAVVAAEAVRRAGDRRPLRHLHRPGEPREAERAHDRPARASSFLRP